MAGETTRNEKGTAAEWVALSTLKPWKRNPRKNKEAISAVARSIESFGFGAPIVARREDFRIIAGHTRYEAARRLALETVPVRFLDVTEEQANALALADNKLGEIAEWDNDQLAAILAELRSHDEDLPKIAGFSDEELTKLLEGAEPRSETTEDEVPLDKADELREKWGTSLGQLWTIPTKRGEHRILCGDSTKLEDAARVMGGDTAVWCWTDPPYGVEYVGGTSAALRIENDSPAGIDALLRGAFSSIDAVLCDGAPIYVAHPAGALSYEFVTAWKRAGWHWHQTIIWAKSTFALGHNDYHYQHEPILYGWKGKNRRWYGGRDKCSVLAHDKPSRNGEHPTMKPVSLVAECLQNSSRAGDLGFEPFSGSGTTLIAAEQTGRLCRAIELSPKYVAVALERLSALGLSPKLCPAS